MVKDGKDKDGNDEVDFVNTELPDIIELKNVSQTYDKGKTFIIKDFNLLIEDYPNIGQFAVILGPSGCGKSTVLKYLSRLQEPSSGEILINGKKPEGSIPMVFQEYSSLPNRTVLGNVMLPLEIKGDTNKEHRDMAIEAIKSVGLEEHMHKFAQRKVLSGGQMQRVAIARSLVCNSRILLMDEPFGALDVNTRFQMQLNLTKLWETLESTVIFVTHDIQEAVFLANDIFIMSQSPASIVKHFTVDLPKVRTREIKRERKYIDLVNEVEDAVLSIKGTFASK
jgi:NitT/TauT family transport system ATP-binding protein